MGEPDPILSIVIPTKNRSALFARALASFRHAGPEAEIVVIDDGSRTEHAARVRGSCADLASCRYHRLEHSRGAARARNIGWRRGRGAHVWFMDDDDFATARTVRDVLRHLRSRPEEAVLLLPRCRLLDGSPFLLDRPSAEPAKYERYRRSGIEVTTSCVVFPRRVLERVDGWDDELPALQDADLLLRVSACATFSVLETEPVRHTVDATGRITFSFVASQVGKIQFLRKHWGILPLSRRVRYLASVLGCAPLYRRQLLRWRAAWAHRRADPTGLLVAPSG